MKENFTGKSSIVINAPVYKVWNALTQPELIKKYLLGANTETDWKVGSPIRFTGEYQGKKYIDKGTILENVPQKRIVYNHWSSLSGKEDKPENYQPISYNLDEDGKITTLTVTQGNIQSEKEREHAEKNWNAVLEELKNIVEKKSVSV
ncbi:MAG TPA: SRPBCC family protein [Bacteroidia bacterium]|nr:SRPBCC family protein [Bacteroidia bacterium]